MDFSFLAEPYQQKNWKELIGLLFSDNADLFAKPTEFPVDNERIQSFKQFGNVRLADGSELALFEIFLQPNTTKLAINRVALRQIVANINQNALLTGALAVYVDDKVGKWRFSFIAKTSQYAESGTLETRETDPKRFTYVFGEGEKIRTAEQRFRNLTDKSGITLDDLYEAFSLEKINREFFDQYKKHYNACWQYLARPDSPAYLTFKINQRLADDKARKPLRDFAKRLMGRLVFLYFLQKKGWMGCPANREDWIQGDPDFTANLFRRLPETEQNLFYSKYLTQLFFNTLNERRSHNQFILPNGATVRVPYLNGGLFDGDVPGTEQFDLPAEWFANLFDFFGQYNFTIDESAPNDQEIGIDPEMLGHIFESLLEENREKGAYYTPKEIVHYMCQESLLLYLKERVGLISNGTTSSNEYNIIWSDSQAADELELETFVRHKRRGEKHNFIYKNARLFETLLNEVRICDPAIGSGAFPMGLLYEIFHCQIELDMTEHPGDLKKDIIHHCIYGVDKDKGAVDIARLRFWLALVVDEDVPQPLPNLDFKIMQGDSLLESFEGIDLSNLLGENGNSKKNPSSQQELFAVVEEPSVQFGEKDKAKLAKWIDRFFEPNSSVEKADLQVKIDNLIDKELNGAIRRYKLSLFTELSNQKSALAREQQDLKRPGIKQQKEIARLEGEIASCETKQNQLAWWQEREEKPFFLWHTWFREVFDRGGFDIVIGNPPYVPLQRLGHYSDILQTQGYETFMRTGDLYCLFYEKAIQSLRPGGIMAYITSNSWLKTLYGEPLRRYFIENSTPVAILNFENAQLFKAAIVETNILLALKGKYSLTTQALNIDEKADSDRQLHEQVSEKGLTLQGLSEKEWIVGDVTAMRLREEMERGNKRLIGYSVEIYRGVLTGFNKAFLVDDEDELKFLFSDYSSQQIVFKTLRGRNLQKYSYEFKNQWLIFTKRGVNIDQYPTVKEHLLKYYDDIRPKNNNEPTGRKPGTYNWFEIQDNVAYHKEFLKPKILWGELSDAPKFSYDDKGYYPEATLFLMTGEKLKYLLAILNSKAGEWYFNQISTTSGMGTNRWKKYKIEQLPIPAATPTQEAALERLVDYMLWLKETQLAGSSPDLQLRIDYIDQIINGLVYELYFTESFKQSNMTLFEHLGDLPLLEEGAQKQIIGAVFQRLSHKEHPLRNNLFYLRTINEVKTIMEGLKSSKHTLETMLGTDYEETDYEN